MSAPYRSLPSTDLLLAQCKVCGHDAHQDWCCGTCHRQWRSSSQIITLMLAAPLMVMLLGRIYWVLVSPIVRGDVHWGVGAGAVATFAAEVALMIWWFRRTARREMAAALADVPVRVDATEAPVAALAEPEGPEAPVGLERPGGHVHRGRS